MPFPRLKRKLESFWDRIRGLDLSTTAYPEDYGHDPDIVFRSSSSNKIFLEHCLNSIGVKPQDSILDVGCGKGNAIIYMSKFPFARIDGIEIIEELSLTAQKNISKLNLRSSKILNLDAVDFKKYHMYNILYFYNPFPDLIMEKVLSMVKKSIKGKKEVLIIYNNPLCHKTFLNQGYFSKIAEYNFNWCRDNSERSRQIFFYSNKKNGRFKIDSRSINIKI